MITAAITLSVISFLFYYLFIKGVAYPIIFFIFGIFGGKVLLIEYFPDSAKTIATFLSYEISYATFIAGLISILAIGFLMEAVEK